MTFKCKECKGTGRKNYPHGRESRAEVTIWHSPNCDIAGGDPNGIILKQTDRERTAETERKKKFEEMYKKVGY